MDPSLILKDNFNHKNSTLTAAYSHTNWVKSYNKSQEESHTKTNSSVWPLKLPIINQASLHEWKEVGGELFAPSKPWTHPCGRSSLKCNLTITVFHWVGHSQKTLHEEQWGHILVIFLRWKLQNQVIFWHDLCQMALPDFFALVFSEQLAKSLSGLSFKLLQGHPEFVV